MSISGTCHCGAMHFTVNAAPTEAVECNCSYCSKSGGLWAYYTPADIVVQTSDADRIYTKSGYNKHHFCANCGCQIYGTSPEWLLDGNHDLEKVKIGINVRLLDDFDLSTVRVTRIDGRNMW